MWQVQQDIKNCCVIQIYTLVNKCGSGITYYIYAKIFLLAFNDKHSVH